MDFIANAFNLREGQHSIFGRDSIPSSGGTKPNTSSYFYNLPYKDIIDQIQQVWELFFKFLNTAGNSCENIFLNNWNLILTATKSLNRVFPRIKNVTLTFCSSDMLAYRTNPESLTRNLLVLSAENLCKQFGPRSGLIKCQA